eukprot:sb/3474718/
MRGLHELLEFSIDSDKEEPELDLTEVVTAVHAQLGTKPNPSGLDLLTVLSRTHPELVNKLLLQQLLEKNFLRHLLQRHRKPSLNPLFPDPLTQLLVLSLKRYRRKVIICQGKYGSLERSQILSTTINHPLFVES